MASFSHPFTEDVDDWAGLSGLTLGSPMGPLLTVVPPTASPSGQGLLVVLPSSSSNASPALTTSLTSTSGEYNGFTFVSGLIDGGGGQNKVCGFILQECLGQPLWKPYPRVKDPSGSSSLMDPRTQS